MSKVIKFYDNRNNMLRDNIKTTHRSLHQDFVNKQLKVTWVNGNDDPAENPPPQRQMTRTQFNKFLENEYDVKII